MKLLNTDKCKNDKRKNEIIFEISELRKERHKANNPPWGMKEFCKSLGVTYGISDNDYFKQLTKLEDELRELLYVSYAEWTDIK